METLHATEPLRVGDLALIAVQRVRVERSYAHGGAFVLASAEPRAIVVEEGDRRRALGLDGTEIALEPLLEEVTGLAQALERARREARADCRPPQRGFAPPPD